LLGRSWPVSYSGSFDGGLSQSAFSVQVPLVCVGVMVTVVVVTEYTILVKVGDVAVAVVMV